MRKLYTLLALMLMAGTMLAQAPQTMTYQAVVRDAENNLITNQTVGMQISILQGSADGAAVYTETLTPTSNANGLVTVKIGGTAGFDAIDWSNGPFYIKTETDPSGGTSYSITGVTQLLSVPYALHAQTADELSNGITETDPVFTAWDKSTGISITESQISDLGTYVETETDPTVPSHVKSITADNVSDWNGAHGWGDHSAEGYLTDYTVTEADVTTHQEALKITESQITDFQIYATKNMNNENITNLADPVNDHDAVTKAYVDLLEEKVNQLTWVLEDVENRGLVNDTEGNQYKTIKIGDQIWMAENLRTTKYNDGTPILTGLSDTEWSETPDGAYAVYPHSSIGLFSDAEVLEAYGALYNWYAVETGNLCPTGWHVPTDAEWTTLTDYVGEGIAAVGKLKSTRTSPDAHPRWNSPNEGASDELGFSALPGGFRWNSGVFGNAGSFGYWWSSTELDATEAWLRSIRFDHGTVYNNSNKKRNGFTVRCLRDN